MQVTQVLFDPVAKKRGKCAKKFVRLCFMLYLCSSFGVKFGALRKR